MELQEVGCGVDGWLGSRLRGYHPVAPRPLRYVPFVHRLWFRPSSPEVLHVKRHDRPLLVKDGIGREMAGQFGLQFWLPRKSQGSLTCRKSATWDRRLYFPSEGRHAVEFFRPKNPTASAGFKPAMLGTRGQHANTKNTSRYRYWVRSSGVHNGNLLYRVRHLTLTILKVG
jgi:hypothetical protein